MGGVHSVLQNARKIFLASLQHSEWIKKLKKTSPGAWYHWTKRQWLFPFRLFSFRTNFFLFPSSEIDIVKKSLAEAELLHSIKVQWLGWFPTLPVLPSVHRTEIDVAHWCGVHKGTQKNQVNKVQDWGKNNHAALLSAAAAHETAQGWARMWTCAMFHGLQHVLSKSRPPMCIAGITWFLLQASRIIWPAYTYIKGSRARNHSVCKWKAVNATNPFPIIS